MADEAQHYPMVGEGEGKKEQVESMFDAIAPRYDLLNRVLSMGVDQGWRRRAVRRLEDLRPKRILDVATGTGDLAIKAMQLQPDEVVGVDLSEEMLAVGREKVHSKGLADRIRLERGDAEDLRFADDEFDAALVAFGVRNFGDLKRGLREIARVVRHGGRLVVLEFSQPRVFPVRQLYSMYSRHVLPRVGAAVSRDSGAYRYLPDSVAAFPHGDDFMRIMRDCGFQRVASQPLTFGIASLYDGEVV